MEREVHVGDGKAGGRPPSVQAGGSALAVAAAARAALQDDAARSTEKSEDAVADELEDVAPCLVDGRDHDLGVVVEQRKDCSGAIFPTIAYSRADR